MTKNIFHFIIHHHPAASSSRIVRNPRDHRNGITMLQKIQQEPQLFAAVGLLSLALLMGVYMSMAFRIFVIFKSKEDAKKMLDGREFKNASAVQLNNAEWAPFHIACHFFLYSNKAGSMTSAVLSMGSCFFFVAFKAFLFPGKPAAVTASARYVALAMLIFEVASVVV